MKFGAKDDVLKKAQAWYQGLDEARRRRLWAAAAIVSVSLGLLLLLIGRTHWAVLYNGLEARDAAAIANKLKADKAPYRLSKGGTEILVDERMVYDLRLSLASQGLPHGQGKGWELLDEGGFNLSEEAARVNRVRALQGELERSILSLEGVEGVRVHLVVPERRLFSRDSASSSASVLLKLKPGVELREEQSAALAHLVSHAVEGLSPGNVSIMDTEGRALGTGEAGGAAMVGSRVEAGRRVERYLHDQVQSLLDEAIGRERSIVRVHAELDFSEQAITKETYEAPTPKGGLVREEQMVTAAESGPGGVAGAAVMSTNGSNPVAATPAKTGNRSDKNVRYELNKTVQSITQGSGSLKRVSVAVLLKDNFPAADQASLKEAVARVVGLANERGDQLSLASIPAQSQKGADPKEAQELLASAKAERQARLVRQVAPWALGAIGFLVMAGVAFFAFRKPKAAAQPARAVGFPPLTLDPNAQPISMAAKGPASEPLFDLVDQHPASAAQVLRRLMAN